MTNKFDANLAITISTNEGLRQPVIVKMDVDGVESVVNVTDGEFQAGVRSNLLANSASVCTLNVAVSNGSMGEIIISLSSDIAKTIEPGTYVYDVLMRLPDADIFKLYGAPFIVQRGTTVWANT